MTLEIKEWGKGFPDFECSNVESGYLRVEYQCLDLGAKLLLLLENLLETLQTLLNLLGLMGWLKISR